MDVLVKVYKQMNVEERQYTDRNGQNATFRFIPCVVDTGFQESMYVEIVGDSLISFLSAEPLQAGCWYLARIEHRVRSFQVDSKERYTTDLRLTQIRKL